MKTKMRVLQPVGMLFISFLSLLILLTHGVEGKIGGFFKKIGSGISKVAGGAMGMLGGGAMGGGGAPGNNGHCDQVVIIRPTKKKETLNIKMPKFKFGKREKSLKIENSNDDDDSMF